ESTGPLGIEEIDILYRVRTPHPEYDDYFNGTYLSLKVNSTEPNDPKLVGDQSYIEGAVWSYYEINAKGLCGFEGLDAPLISTLT
ncbi:hypothetical protein, partial [Bacteroides thetaiotaomicron]|uniref:hypothetical protein n=1 Tax=Bacteroides thetaiotaomicron TaxID=818 RepID=UPI0019277709